jgi:hypothetical protein
MNDDYLYVAYMIIIILKNKYNDGIIFIENKILV